MLDMKSFNSTNFNLNSLDNNKLLAGISIVMLNIGSRYLVLDISDSTKELLQLSIIRRVTLFCIFYLGTRSFKMSILLNFNTTSPSCNPAALDGPLGLILLIKAPF